MGRHRAGDAQARAAAGVYDPSISGIGGRSTAGFANWPGGSCSRPSTTWRLCSTADGRTRGEPRKQRQGLRGRQKSRRPQALTLDEAPICRRPLQPAQADGKGRLPRLRRRDHRPIRHAKELRGPAAPLGGRAQLRLDDPLAAACPRLRSAGRRFRSHGPRRNGR